MDKVEVKVTWGLVWSFWWRMMLISLGVWLVSYLILILVGVAIFTLW